ncbi:hypothetical protein PTKIN_Ptkin15bG0076400 [Pterospermum kingtungense]
MAKRACSSTEPLSEPNEVARDALRMLPAMWILFSLQMSITSKLHENNNNEAADVETKELILFGNPENCTEIGKGESSVRLNALGTENSMLYAVHETKESGSSSNRDIDIEDCFLRTPHVSLVTLANDCIPLLENTSGRGSSNDYLKYNGLLDLNVDLCKNSSLNRTMVKEENTVAMSFPSSSQNQVPEGLRAGLNSESGFMIHSTDSVKQEKCLKLKSEQDIISKMGDIDNDSFNPVDSRTSQTCRIDLLEEIIEDAKYNKKILFQAMQSIMNLMREV